MISELRSGKYSIARQQSEPLGTLAILVEAQAWLAMSYVLIEVEEYRRMKTSLFAPGVVLMVAPSYVWPPSR